MHSGKLQEKEALSCIFNAIELSSGGTFLEVGAGNLGKDSNVKPFLNHGWFGILIEPDPNKYIELLANTQGYRVQCLNRSIGLETNRRLDTLITSYYDVLSLDIDGYDYWIWHQLEHRPLVVVIEYNSNFEPSSSITIPYNPHHKWDGTAYFGASARALELLGRQKGYDLVGFTAYRNLYFVRSDVNTLPIMETLQQCYQAPHHKPVPARRAQQLMYNPEATRLHLGCGSIHLPGFINIDKEYQPGVDEVADVRYLHPRKYPPRSVRLIYASHILEHFSRWEVKEVLSRWYTILEPEGILRLSVPDFNVLIDIYKRTNDLSLILGGLYGGQTSSLDLHKRCWTEKTLREALFHVGFTKVRTWNWRKVEHCFFDDNSQAYYPHMDKENGICTSLNLEGVK